MIETLTHYLLIHFIPLLLFTFMAYWCRKAITYCDDFKGFTKYSVLLICMLFFVTCNILAATRVVAHDATGVEAANISAAFCLTSFFITKRIELLLIVNLIIGGIAIVFYNVN